MKTKIFVALIPILLSVLFLLCACGGGNDGVGEIPDKHRHFYGEWTLSDDSGKTCDTLRYFRSCVKCGEIEWKTGRDGGHKWSKDFSYDDDYHWYGCEYCEAKRLQEEHYTVSGGYCLACGNAFCFLDGIRYELSYDKSYAIAAEYVGSDADVVIAGSFRGVPVTEIDSGMFKSFTGIKSVTIPASITFIDFEVFDKCNELTAVYISDVESWCNIEFDSLNSNPLSRAGNLYVNGELAEEIVIPAGVTDIGEYAFHNCTSLKRLTLADGVTAIGNYTFYNCSNLENVTISDSVTSIGSDAFVECIRLEQLNISENSELTTIGRSAFRGCNNLLTVTIPKKVTNIEFNAFGGCVKLVEVYNLSELDIDKNTSANGSVGYHALNIYTDSISESNLRIDSDGYVFYEDGDICYLMGYVGSASELILPESCNGKNYGIYSYGFYNNSDITAVTIPDTVTFIDEYAFRNCTSLESVSVGKGVPYIPTMTFAYCEALTDVTLSEGLRSIHEYVFADCVNIKEIIIPEGVSNIGNYAFGGCESLVSITLPSTLQWIDGNEFDGCVALTSIGVSEDNKWLSSIDGHLYSKNCKRFIKYASGKTNTSFVVPDSVTEIGSNAFSYGINLVSITIPHGIEKIEYYTFSNCESLTDIVIPDSVTAIRNSAFSGCKSLTDIIIPDSVTNIGLYAFRNCISLTNVTLPKSITSLDALFYMCKSLRTVEIPSGVTAIGETAFYGCESLESITIPEGVTTIETRAFGECTNLKSVTIPHSVTRIEYDAFSNCISLTDVYAVNIIDWCNIVFASELSNPLYYAGNLYFNKHSVSEIIIPEIVTSIGAYTFVGFDNLVSITIHADLTSIGYHAFGYCEGLTTIKYSGTEEQWNKISKSEEWDLDTGAYTVICKDTEQ